MKRSRDAFAASAAAPEDPIVLLRWGRGSSSSATSSGSGVGGVAFLPPRGSFVSALRVSSRASYSAWLVPPSQAQRAQQQPLDALVATLPHPDYAELGVRTETPLLGTGASAVVLQTAWRGAPVAAKIFRQREQRQWRMFENELRVMAAVGPHPNLIGLVGCSVAGGPPAILLEQACHGGLFELLHNDRELSTRRSSSSTSPAPAVCCPTPVRPSAMSSSSSSAATTTPTMMSAAATRAVALRRRARLAIGIARGMAHLHRHRFAHLDLTSRNVLVGADFEAKVCDYGLAVPLSPADGTATHKIGHAPSFWKAPELSHGRNERVQFDAKVDVFSFAVIVWELFHPGQWPWDGQVLNPEVLLQQGRRPPISADCPPEWRMLIVACWQHRPEDRPYSMDIVRWMDDNLDALLAADCDSHQQ